MFADDVLNYLKSSWKEKFGAKRGISEFSNPTSVRIDHIEFVARLGDVAVKERDRLRTDLQDLIENDGSSIVCGAYTYNNFTERPDNTCFFVYERSELRPILTLACFFRKNDLNLSSSMDISEETLKYAADLLQAREKVFIFAAGVKISEQLSIIFREYRQSHNTVYKLNREIFRPNRQLPDGYSSTILTKQNMPVSGPNLDPKLLKNLEEINQFYNYGKNTEDLIKFIQSQTHILIKNNQTSEICAAARANSTTGKYSVIGGVQTLPNFRQKGLGSFMCGALTEYLMGESEFVSLETDLDNFPARKIYEGMGFEPCGRSVFIDRGTDTITVILGDRDY